MSVVEAEPDPLLDRLLDERYRVSNKLGEGAMGGVYRVEHTKLGKSFAMKVILPELGGGADLLARFEREARSMSRLNHPNIVSVTDFGTIDQRTPYLIMEYVEGESLDKLIQEQPIPLKFALEITLAVLEALSHAHGEGVVHRDVKPANVMVSGDASRGHIIKLADFGLAKVMEAEEGQDLTRTGVVFGTPEYMAPEQATGQAVGPPADVYATASMLWRALIGTPVFQGENVVALLRRKITSPTPSLDDAAPRRYSRDFVSVISKALEPDPELRTSSARAFYEQLVPFVEDPALAVAAKEPAAATMPLEQSAPARLWSSTVQTWQSTDPSKRRLVAGATAALMVALVLWVAWPSKTVGTNGPPPLPAKPKNVAAELQKDLAGDQQKALAAIDALLLRRSCKQAKVRVAALLKQYPQLAAAKHAEARVLHCSKEYAAVLPALNVAFKLEPAYRKDKTTLAIINKLLSLKAHRTAAMQWIEKHPSDGALRILAKAATHRKSAIRHAAIATLTRLGKRDLIDWVPSLEADLDATSDCKVKRELVARLAKLDDHRALTALRRAQRKRSRGIAGAFGRKRHRCVRKEIRAAIKDLRKRLPPTEKR